jgi:squalene-hopene/tetraprenyl-beta-curcumene cyclase
MAIPKPEESMREQVPYILPAALTPFVLEGSIQLETSKAHSLADHARTQAEGAAAALLSMQVSDGSWCGPLVGDSTLLSDYLLLQLWLYPTDESGHWVHPNPNRIGQVVNSIWAHELADGGWSLYPGGSAEINATVRAYTALKLAGQEPRSSRMRRVRKLIIELGGLQSCNSYTKINLSFFGLFPRRFVPTVPPELLIIPGNVLYEMSSWTRTIIVPLAIVQALGATRCSPHGMNVEELIHPHKRLCLPKRDRISEIFVQADRLFKIWEQKGIRKIRTKAVRAAERWMLEHLQFSDGLGAIYPSMMYAIMAMDALGYERDQPDLVRAIHTFEDLLIEQDGSIHFQPAKSPVWDTAITAFALGEMGAQDQTAMTRAADWLLQREIRRKGDWSEKRPELTPSGWAFEYANDFYPDIDDTAMVLLALEHAKASDPQQQEKAERRAMNWLLGMQSSDGGWAAFDVDNNWEILNKVPFADHNAMLDPTCPDITGRVLECLCRRGMSRNDHAVQRGIQFLLRTQEENGSWYGRWGVNYIYGTFLAVRGLQASAGGTARKQVHRAQQWLVSVQNADGGWGESCDGYKECRFVRAESTPSQTAWALLGLIAAGGAGSQPVTRGVTWLLDHQNSDGTWNESLATGTGFPNVFYLRYDMYRNYFPTLTLAVYHRAITNP